jgi:RHS repeat-associated protein
VGGNKSDIQYDAKGNPISFTDFEGATTVSVYDTDRGLPTSITQADGTAQEKTTLITWHATLRKPLTIVEPTVVASTAHTRTTTYTYNRDNQVATKVVSTSSGEPSRTWSYAYNSENLLETITDPLSRVQTFLYDTEGNLIYSENPANIALSYAYTADGYLSEISQSNGLKTKLSYDDMRKVVKIERGARSAHWETTDIQYTSTGQVSQVDLPNGDWIKYFYDNTQRLYLIQTPTGYQNLSYDGHGRVNFTSEQDNSFGWMWWRSLTYDRIGNVIKSTGSQYNTEYEYDDEGRLLVEDDLYQSSAKGGAYDALGRLTNLLDENSETYGLSYDPQDQVVAATDSRSNTTAYSYNGFGELVGLSSPDAGSQGFTVNAVGEVVSKTDARGATTLITRDDLGRPTQITYSDVGVLGSPDGFAPGIETQTFTYDACTNGIERLCSMTDNSGTTTYTYDLWGRVASKAFTPATTILSFVVEYGYSTGGELNAITYPSGRTLDISNSQGDPTALVFDGYTILSNATYRPFHGASLGWDWGGGLGNLAFTYNAENQLSGVGGTHDDKSYQSVGVGLLGWTTDNNDPDNDAVYGRDARDSITYTMLANRPNDLYYTYDENQNRLTSQTQYVSTTTFDYANNSNRLTSVTLDSNPAQAWDYDASGNLIEEDGADYLYDAKGRMVQANVGGQVMTYAYNAQGQRMRKTRTLGGNAGTDFFIYDEEGRILGVYDENGALREELVWFDGWRPVATIRGSLVAPDIYRITSDQLGAPLSVMDDNGVRIWEWDGREPFGFQFPNQDVDGDTNYFILNLRFPGQWADMETALYHNVFRDYHPKAGRYIQSDPIGLDGGWNTYAYVDNNPVNHIDPTGLIKKDATGGTYFSIGQNELGSIMAPFEHCQGKYWWKKCAIWQPGFIYTDLGRMVPANKYVSGDAGLAQNCHGYALGLNLWVNDPTKIYEDEYKITTPEKANIIYYPKASWAPWNKTDHSSRITPFGIYGKNGSGLIKRDAEGMRPSEPIYYGK